MTRPADILEAIFDADRRLRVEEQALLAADAAALRAVLVRAVQDAAKLAERKEATMRLERLSDLCAQVEGPEMTDALIAILDDEAPSVRVQAAEALVDVGFSRYAELARGVERTLDRGARGLAMRELPWILCEIAEPSARPLIARFLQSPEVEVVASAVEALAELGDPAAVENLEPLAEDARPIEVDDEEEGLAATLGELVRESIAALDADE
jgi:HEAT repeat protein